MLGWILATMSIPEELSSKQRNKRVNQRPEIWMSTNKKTFCKSSAQSDIPKHLKPNGSDSLGHHFDHWSASFLLTWTRECLCPKPPRHRHMQMQCAHLTASLVQLHHSFCPQDS